LYHWIDVLDMFDEILEKACTGNNIDPKIIVAVLRTTEVLLRYGDNDRIYNSVDVISHFLDWLTHKSKTKPNQTKPKPDTSCLIV
jgi:hypothetical protein